MRILQVIHQYPPFSSQGSEVYCANLSQALRRADDVRVFHVSSPAPGWRRRFVRGQQAGVPTYHCVDRMKYARMAAWPNAFLQASFQRVLKSFRPEVVHFHNFISLADDLVTMARGNRAGVVYTLHDFNLICPNGLLLRHDERLCTKSDPEVFEDCCPLGVRSARVQALRLAARLPALERWKAFANAYPRPVARRVLRWAVSRAERLSAPLSASTVATRRAFFLVHTRRIFQDVDLFLAPSQFLMRRFVTSGLPAEKVVHTRYGMRLNDHAGHAVRRATPPQIRFGYIGALHRHKGVELLLDAFEGLGDRASLHVHGSLFSGVIGRRVLDRLGDSRTSNVHFHGAYDNNRVGEILGGIDVIVVPSLWYENSPLTIQEGFLHGVPVITAASGGMAELVQDGVNGLLFRLGDTADLRDKMLRVINEPEILDRLRLGRPTVTAMDQHADDLRAIYRRLRP